MRAQSAFLVIRKRLVRKAASTRKRDSIQVNEDWMQFDAFICHASEDKDAVARPLADALKDRHFSIWYDEFSLEVGDSLREAIDRGLAESKFAVVVVSPSFFNKRWTQRELNGLVAQEMNEGRSLILPNWHDIQLSEIICRSPPLADVRAIRSVEGIEKVADQIARRIRPNASPLVVARDILASFHWQLPPLTDEWWIDIVELRESIYSSYQRRPFMFPLRDDYSPDRLRGTQLAWAVLMNDWSLDAEELCICQVTPPDQVHEFISSRPALREMAHASPDHLATYVPQLLIPGFSGEFEGLFDELVAHPSELFWKQQERELGCLRRHAFRFANLGGHSPVDIADKWRDGIGGSSYSGHVLDDSTYLFGSFRTLRLGCQQKSKIS